MNQYSSPSLSYAARMRQKLIAALQPQQCLLVDETAQHHGHAGVGAGASETHFSLTLVAAAFAGQSRLQRQRWVYSLLAEEMREKVHALRLQLQTPEEAQMTEDRGQMTEDG